MITYLPEAGHGRPIDLRYDTRPWVSMVVMPETPIKPEQLSGLAKPASRKDGLGRRKSQ